LHARPEVEVKEEIMKPTVLIIGGPTAVGKTATSIEMAKRHNGEVISADSMQIYKHMDIGSAKPTKEEMGDVPHHLIDFINPKDSYSVSDFQKDAFEKIDDVIERGKLPIVVGGTGLYLNALMYEMDFSEAVGDPAFREEMRKQAIEKGSEYIHDLLKEVDPEAAERIHHRNMKRVIRALEICRVTGGTSKDFAKDPVLNDRYNFVFIALTGNRKKLYARINKRVDQMFEAGLIEEVKNLKNLGLTDSHQSMKGIGYKEVLAYLDNRYDFDTMVSIIKQSSRRYAKRQLTWLRRYENLQWFDIDKLGGLTSLLDHIDNYIKQKKA
jgi:tRNA dimethylallyltransferase